MDECTPVSEQFDVVDTSPPGADPSQPLDFSGGGDDERDEVGDPQRFSDEPWDDLDPEAAVELSEDFLSFGNIELEDTSSFECWLQSALKALVDPRLAVDGKLGPRTRTAVKTFQRRAREFHPRGPALVADGVVGKQTIAALEAATGSSASGDSEDEREAPTPEDVESIEVEVPAATAVAVASVVGDGELVVQECGPADDIEYVIRAGGDTVRFRYWTPDWNKYKPFNVSRYVGARKGLLSDAQILAGGYSTSELKILKANALKESGGAFGAINTWDDQIVSWGMAQFAGHAGTLAALLAELKDDSRSAAAYARWFVGNGIDVAFGAYPYKDSTRKGWHVVVRAGDRVHAGDDGWRHIRSQPRLIGAFLLAGNDPAIQLGQVLFWRRSFLTRAIGKHIGKLPAKAPGAAVSRFFTAERTLALVVRLYNWMPAYVVPWCDRFLAELARDNPDKAVHDPDAWDDALETAMAGKIAAERKRVKSGSYDTYALDLSRIRGSFVASRA